MSRIWPYQWHLGGMAVAIIQALGSNATTAGFSADHGTEDRLLEALTNADRARGPPREAVALERARDGIPKRA